MKLSEFLEEAAIMKEMKHPNLVQVRSFIYSCIHSFIRSLINLFILSYIHSFIHLYIHAII